MFNRRNYEKARGRDAQQTNTSVPFLRAAELDFENENAGAAPSTFRKNWETDSARTAAHAFLHTLE